ncbi:hypothetical protein FRC18_000321 [Serendipita sp. 400]|nr:hypothetical protein FRC18_000321 [Serendipita sp. 400]
MSIPTHPLWTPTPEEELVLIRHLGDFYYQHQLSVQAFNAIEAELSLSNQGVEQEHIREWWNVYRARLFAQEASIDPSLAVVNTSNGDQANNKDEKEIKPNFRLAEARNLFAKESGIDWEQRVVDRCAERKLLDQRIAVRLAIRNGIIAEHWDTFLLPSEKEAFLKRAREPDYPTRKERPLHLALKDVHNKHREAVLELQKRMKVATVTFVLGPGKAQLGSMAAETVPYGNAVSFEEWANTLDAAEMQAFAEVLLKYNSYIWGKEDIEKKIMKKGPLIKPGKRTTNHEDEDDDEDAWFESKTLVLTPLNPVPATTSLVDLRKMVRDTLRERYCLSGRRGAIPWKAIRENPSGFYTSSKFPEGWSFDEPSRMMKDDCIAMLVHLYKGDHGKLSPDDIVSFSKPDATVRKHTSKSRAAKKKDIYVEVSDDESIATTTLPVVPPIPSSSASSTLLSSIAPTSALVDPLTPPVIIAPGEPASASTTAPPTGPLIMPSLTPFVAGPPVCRAPTDIATVAITPTIHTAAASSTSNGTPPAAPSTVSPGSTRVPNIVSSLVSPPDVILSAGASLVTSSVVANAIVPPIMSATSSNESSTAAPISSSLGLDTDKSPGTPGAAAPIVSPIISHITSPQSPVIPPAPSRPVRKRKNNEDHNKAVTGPGIAGRRPKRVKGKY